MSHITPVSVEALPEYTGLDEDNANNYYRACRRKALISSEIINPFEVSLRGFTGYSDENIPDGEIEIPCDIGDFRFVMKATPTTKRPGYRDVFDELHDYLKTKLAEYKAGNRPVGVFTIEGKPYISARDVLTRLKKAKKRVISKGVKIEISDIPALIPHSGSVVIPLGMDTSELTEGNAARYLEARSLSEDYAKLISAFEEELLELTGYDNNQPPEQTEYMFKQIGSHIFRITSVPYQSTSWGKVIAGLDKEPPKKKPENGGDLVLATRNIEVPRLRIYDIRQREGDNLVRLDILLRRMEKMVKENTSIKVRQKPIIHYPLV